MAFNWENFLTLAEKIQNSTDGKPVDDRIEALRRTAINRAYYSALHKAEEYAVKNLSYEIPTTGRHGLIRTKYRSAYGSVAHQDVGTLLSRLNRQRNKSDYHEDGLGDVQAMLREVILNAQKVQSLLST